MSLVRSRQAEVDALKQRAAGLEEELEAACRQCAQKEQVNTHNLSHTSQTHTLCQAAYGSQANTDTSFAWRF